MVQIHVNQDAYVLPWGQDRGDSFYRVSQAIPAVIFDGEEEWPIEDYGYALQQRLAVPTDVTISLVGSEVADQLWLAQATVCVEAGGQRRDMRVHAVEVLDYWPRQVYYSRNGLRQVADAQDVTVEPGTCTVVENLFEFDNESWSQRDLIDIVVWAQAPWNTGPAAVFQAAQMRWPFPPPPQPPDPHAPRRATGRVAPFPLPKAAHD